MRRVSQRLTATSAATTNHTNYTNTINMNSCNTAVRGTDYHVIIIIIIRQPLCPVVGRRPQHAVSKLPCLVLSSAISCRSSMCPGRLSTAWLVSLVVFSCQRVVHRLSLRRLICPAQDHFIFSHSVHYIYDVCPLPDPDVGPSIFVCDVEHTSFQFGLCGRKFVMCLFGQYPGLCTICDSCQRTGSVHMSLQADGKVAFENIPASVVCSPDCMILRCIWQWQTAAMSMQL